VTAVRFHDRMGGYISFAETDYNQAVLDGRRVGRRCAFDLDIAIYDVDGFLDGSEVTGSARGEIQCAELGGRLEVTEGTFALFQDMENESVRRMRYRLFARDRDGRELTLSGFKDIADSPNFDVWSDTTTLLIRLLAGRVSETEEEAADPADMAARTIATGVLRISLLRFLLLLASMRPTDGSPVQRASALLRFLLLFGQELIEVYGGQPPTNHLPDFPDPVAPGSERWHGHPAGKWHRPPELPGLWRRIVPFETEDERQGTLHNVRRDPKDEGRVPVLLIHGAGVRANLFYGAPGRASIIPFLLHRGFDVWLENWRASIDLPPSDYTLDEAARYDHPAAIKQVLASTAGHEKLRVLCHCQGSTSFIITYLARRAPEVERVVSSAVSLHPVVPTLTWLKVSAVVPVLGLLTPYVSAQWGARPPTPFAHALALFAHATHEECDDPVCALGNFMYGTGPDVLWRHANLDAETLHWTSREFGYAPFSFMKQMRESILAGHLVPTGTTPGLPDDYLNAPPPQATPWTFVAGGRNRLFVSESQKRTFEHFGRKQPGLHSLAIVENYGHLDIVFGKDAPVDAYPAILEGLGAA
jgi:hypothetical protein